jgi:predicted HTH transcriptional regulator
MSNKLDDMIASVTKLSEEDLVLGFIRGGENRNVEFKETFEFNTHMNGNRDSRLVDSCIKTIGAFLNSGGGNLLVGVSDDQQIIGIERDIKMNKGTNDGFLLHFKNFIEKRIGQEYYNVIDQKIITVRNKPILWVNCSSAKEAKLGVVFVDNEDCYVRTNPATDKLTGRELETFLRNFSAIEA